MRNVVLFLVKLTTSLETSDPIAGTIVLVDVLSRTQLLANSDCDYAPLKGAGGDFSAVFVVTGASVRYLRRSL